MNYEITYIFYDGSTHVYLVESSTPLDALILAKRDADKNTLKYGYKNVSTATETRIVQKSHLKPIQ